MNINELQKELRKIKRKFGDLNIKVEDIFEGYSPDTDLMEVLFKKHKEGGYICLR